MTGTNQVEDDDLFTRFVMPKQSKLLEGVRIPLYCFGLPPLPDHGPSGELSCFLEDEESILDTFLLGQWEDRMTKGNFRYDVTTSEIKAIDGRKKFLAQLNEGWNVDHLTMPEENKAFHQADVSELCSTKHLEELLFCVVSAEKLTTELIASPTVPDNGVLIFLNASPVEYGHVLLVPYRSNCFYKFLDASCLKMAVEVSVGINNCCFRLFYDCSPHTSHFYFQACYFPNPLAVELMPLHTIYGNVQCGIQISAVAEYPVKTLLFECNHKFERLMEVLAEICSVLKEKCISYNLLVSDGGKKIFLFLQQKLKNSTFLSAWECGGYFLFKSRTEFDQATEKTILKHLTTVSLDDESFIALKVVCCSIAMKSGL